MKNPPLTEVEIGNVKKTIVEKIDSKGIDEKIVELDQKIEIKSTDPKIAVGTENLKKSKASYEKGMLDEIKIDEQINVLNKKISEITDSPKMNSGTNKLFEKHSKLSSKEQTPDVIAEIASIEEQLLLKVESNIKKSTKTLKEKRAKLIEKKEGASVHNAKSEAKIKTLDENISARIDKNIEKATKKLRAERAKLVVKQDMVKKVEAVVTEAELEEVVKSSGGAIGMPKREPFRISDAEVEVIKQEMLSDVDKKIGVKLNQKRSTLLKTMNQIKNLEKMLVEVSSGDAIPSRIHRGMNSQERILDGNVLLSEHRLGSRKVIVLESTDDAVERLNSKYKGEELAPRPETNPVESIKEIVKTSDIIATPKEMPLYGELIERELKRQDISYQKSSSITPDKVEVDIFTVNAIRSSEDELRLMERLEQHKIVYAEGDTPKSFAANNFHVVQTFLDDAAFEVLIRDLDVRFVNDVVELTRQGREDFTTLLDWTRNGGNAVPSDRTKLVYGQVRSAFSELFIQKGRVNAGRYDPIPMTRFEKEFSEYFNVAGTIDQKITNVANDFIKDEMAFLKNSFNQPVSKDVIDGLLDSAKHQGISFQTVFTASHDVKLAEAQIIRTMENRHSKARTKLRHRPNELTSSETIRDLRPSKYPNAFYKDNMVPERTRAKRNKAREFLEDGQAGITEADVDLLLQADGGRFKITPEDLDTAFYQLVDEGKDIDFDDIMSRLMQYTERISVMSQNKGKWVSLTPRTFVREDRVPYYKSATKKKKLEIFKVDSYEELIAKFDDVDTDIDLSLPEASLSRQQTLFTIIDDQEVISNLRAFVNQNRITPGVASLDGNLINRIEGDAPVKFYLYDLNEISGSMLDMTASYANGLAGGLNKFNIHPVWSMVLGISSGLKSIDAMAGKLTDGLVGGGPTPKIDDLTDWLGRAVDAVFENYDPLLKKNPLEKASELNPAIIRATAEYQDAMRGMENNIQNFFDLIREKASKETLELSEEIVGKRTMSSQKWIARVESVERLFGGDLSFVKKGILRSIGPSMQDLGRLLPETLKLRVDPVFIPKMKSLVNETRIANNGRIIDVTIFDLELGSKKASVKLSLIEQFLKEEGVDMSVDIEIARNFIDNKDALDGVEGSRTAAFDARDRIISKSLGLTRAKDPMTLKSWGDGLLNEYAEIIGRPNNNESLAFKELDVLIQKYKGREGVKLDDEDVIIMKKSVSTIINGAQERYNHVVYKGRTIYQSVVGNQEAGIRNNIDPSVAIRAYTLFYTGRHSIGNIDLKRIQNSKRFEASSPPNGDRWRFEDVVEIYSQYGFKYDKANALESIAKQFDLTPKKLLLLSANDADILLSGVANRISLASPEGFSSNLMQLGIDQGDIAIPLKGWGKVDLTKVHVEMVVRLLAEENLQNYLNKLASVRIYGDIQKVSREELIKVGLNPVTDQEALKNLVVQKIHEYTTAGPIDVNLEGIWVKRKTSTSIELAAETIASDMIQSYKLKTTKSDPHLVVDLPSGEQIVISQELYDGAVSIIDDVAPSGKARLDKNVTMDDWLERKHNTSKLRYALEQSDNIKKYLSNEMKWELIDQGIDQGEAGFQAGEIVDLFLAGKNPELGLRKMIEGIDLKYDDMYKFLSEGLDDVAKIGLRDYVGNMKMEQLKATFGVTNPVSIMDKHAFFLDAKYQIAEAKLLQTQIKAAETKQLQKVNAAKEAGLEAPKELYFSIDSDLNLVSSPFNNILRNVLNFASTTFMPSSGTGKNPLGAISAFNTAKKMSVTTGFILPTFAYYFNNIFGAAFQLYNTAGLGGMTSSFSTAFRHHKVYSEVQYGLYGQPRLSTSKNVMITTYGDAYTAQDIISLCKQYAVGSSFIHTELASSIADNLRTHNTRKFFSIGTAFSAPNAMQNQLNQAANATDNMFRVSTFMDRLKQGDSPSDAAKFTRETYFDYAALTDFEKKWIREAFLFYSFMRKNQVQTFRVLRDNPQRAINQMRYVQATQRFAMEDEDRVYLAEYEKSRMMFTGTKPSWNALGERVYLDDKYGRKIYFAPAIGLFDGLAMVTPFANTVIESFEKYVLGMEGKDPLKTAIAEGETLSRFFAGQLSPIPKHIAEWTMGKEVFGNRDYKYKQVKQSQVDNLNFVFSLSGYSLFADGELGGLINIELDETPYKGDLRINEPVYSFKQEKDLIMYLLVMEAATVVPGARIPGNLFSGRPAITSQKAIDVGKSFITGEPFYIPAGSTLEDEVLTFFGIRYKVMPRTKEAKRKFLKKIKKDTTDKINKETSNLE